MIVVLKQNSDKERVERLMQHFKDMGLRINYSEGEDTTILGLMGDTTRLDEGDIMAYDVVERVQRVTEPFKAVNRKFHPEDTIIEVAGRKIGAGYFNVMAGPCSVENEAQIVECAERVKAAGASFLRGGAFKPRTSPYSFQGSRGRGPSSLLLEAKRQTGLPIVTEIMSEKHLDLFADVDIIQLGARNMQNFMLLKELGRCNKPILLKRGLSATMEEFLMAAEYIFAGGNKQVILCERGIRTFEKDDPQQPRPVGCSARQDVQPPADHHRPVSRSRPPRHGSALSRAAIAAGADGLIIEAHNDPKHALCDGAQSLDLDQFDHVMSDIKRRAEFEGRIMMP